MKKFILLSAALIAAFTATSCSGLQTKKIDDGRTVYAEQKKINPRSSIEGLVVNSSTGKGIGKAKVEIKNSNRGIGYYLVETDSSGNFKIDDFITQVNYAVEVQADGFVTYTSAGMINEGKHTISLTPEAILAGQVKDTAGRPVKGVEVKIKYANYDEYDSGKPLIVQTDDAGNYRFNKLVQGSYSVTYSAPGFITETSLLQMIKAGETFSLPMMVTRPASISGKIMIADINAAASNIDVVLKGRYTYSVSSFQDGSYSIEDVKPGKYKLILTHQGFFSLESKIIEIKEGSKTAMPDSVVSPKLPEVEVYAYRYTFTPGDKLEFNMKTFRLESVKAAVYRVPAAEFIDDRSDPSDIDLAEKGFKKVISWEEGINDFTPYDWCYQILSIKDPLPIGGYCVEISGEGGIVSRKFFTITSVGIVAKRSGESVMIFASNLMTNEPVAGAEVALYDTTPVKKKNNSSDYNPPERIEELPVKIIKKGKTGADGIFHAKLSSSQYLSALALSPDGSYAICNTGAPYSYASEKNKYFIYTDRPVYRAGDTVFYKIIGKTRSEKMAPSAGAKIYYSIMNASVGKKMDEGFATLDDWGTAHAKFTIPKEGNLGDYHISVGLDKKTMIGKGIFYVEQYRKPEYNIEITPVKDYYVNGETAEFKVEAKYFFGAPLKGALVRYRFYETILKESGGWREDEYQESGSYYRLRLEGEKFADANGIALLKLATGTYPYDREITVEATVVDSSNVSITSTKKIRIGRGDFYIKIEPDQHFFEKNQKKKINITALNHTGKPVRAAVNIELYKYIWKPVQRVYVHDAKPLFAAKVTTDENGRGSIELPAKFAYSGEFDLKAEARDKFENTISSSRVIWIYDSYGSVSASKFKNFELVLDNTDLKSPGEVTCLVKSRYTDAYVCLTLEGRDIYETKVIKMTGNVMPVKFNIKSEYAPNLYLSAFMQRKRALYSASAGISLPITDTALDITIKPDKEKYEPGDKAKITITATSGGKPAAADLSLAAVDESIYQIRYDHTPKMQNFFYSKISNWVMTSYSYPITVLAGAGKDGKGKVREKFEDTAFWKADIRTSKDGTAVIEFTLPDNLTTWRLTARGHDRVGRVGEKTNKFLVTKDIIARLGKPRFFTEGDTISLIGIVNSNTGAGITKVDAAFKVDGKEIKSADQSAISLPPYGSARKMYQYQVKKGSEDAVIEYSAGAAGGFDALRVRVPVQRRGAHYTLFASGDMGMNKSIKITPVKGDDDFKFVPEKVVLTVNPSPVIQMVRAAEFLDGYPYGCVEQTLNRFVPALVLTEMMKRRGMTSLVNPKALNDLKGKVKNGIANIQENQNDDGTWGWFSGDRGNGFITGYVLYSLYLSSKFGYTVEPERIKLGLEAVERILNDKNKTSLDEAAWLLYIYALYGKWHGQTAADITGGKSVTAYQLAFLSRASALALNRPGRSEKEIEFMKKSLNDSIIKIKQAMKKDRFGIYWEADNSQRWGWQGANTELTAHILAALVEGGDSSPISSQIIKSLTARSKGGAWASTKETASVIFAMCAYLEKNSSESSLKGNISFKLNGEPVGSIDYDLEKNSGLETLEKTVYLKDKGAAADFALEASGEAGADTGFDAAVYGTLYFEDRGFSSIFKSEGAGLNKLSNALTVTRSFSAIKRVRDMNNSEYLVPYSIGDKKTISVGDEIMVKLRFKAADSFEYLVLEDFLPSGFEVTKSSAYDLYLPFVHSERWDNRMVFFFTNLVKDEVYEVAYIIRAELPGRFMVRPARMECMYEPSIQGWSTPLIIEVIDGK